MKVRTPDGTEVDAVVVTDDTPLIVCLSDVQPEAVEWLWPGRLARGKQTLIAGDPGVGKSLLTIDMAARITSGMAWPDGSPTSVGNVLCLCAEDGLRDTVRRRLDAHGGDPARFFAMPGLTDTSGILRPLNLARDLDALETALVKLQPLLVIIDPITAYLGRTDSYKDAEVRGLLAPLLALMEKHRCALLTVAHLAKDQQRAALHRPGGSVAFVAAARLVFAVAADANDADRRIVAPLKSNLCVPAPSVAFRLPDGRVTWDTGHVDVNADTLLRPGSPEDRETQLDADKLLTQLLDDFDWPMDAKAVLEAASAHGINERTLRRAGSKRGIQIRRSGFGKGGRWLWHRPAHTGQAASPLSDVSAMAPMQKPASKGDNNNIEDTFSCTEEAAAPAVNAAVVLRMGRPS